MPGSSGCLLNSNSNTRRMPAVVDFCFLIRNSTKLALRAGHQQGLPLQPLLHGGVGVEPAALGALGGHEHGLEQRLLVPLVLDVVPVGRQVPGPAQPALHRLGGGVQALPGLLGVAPDRSRHLLGGRLGGAGLAPDRQDGAVDVPANAISGAANAIAMMMSSSGRLRSVSSFAGIEPSSLRADRRVPAAELVVGVLMSGVVVPSHGAACRHRRSRCVLPSS